MKMNPLGRSGLSVSEICLGTMTWGTQNSEAEGHAQMDMAVERGVNFFDTAEMYPTPPSAETQGRTEEIIGSWFRKSGSRSDIILATKITGKRMIPWVRDGRGINRAEIADALHASLKRLGTDYVDLYQLHWPNRGSYHFGNHWNYDPQGKAADIVADFEETLEALDTHVTAGKIRHVGLSNETVWGTAQYLRLAEERGWPRMHSLQNEYSLLCRVFERDFHELAIAEDCGLLAWSPLASGMLTGKYQNGARPPGSRWTLLRNRPPRDVAMAHAAVARYVHLARQNDLDPAAMAIAFTLSRPFTTSSIIGATSLDQLEVCLGAADVTLSDTVMDAIAEIYRDYPLPY